MNENNEKETPKIPPPPEITIRTMKSDLKSVSTGEIQPTPEKVSAEELKKSAPGPIQEAKTIKNKLLSNKKYLIIGIAAVVLIGLGILVYFLVK